MAQLRLQGVALALAAELLPLVALNQVVLPGLLRRAAGLLAFLLQADAAGTLLADCYLGVDDAPAPLHEVVGWLREQLGVSHWAEQSSVRRAGSKRCSNARARALGWVPQYPSYREGYAAVLADAQSSLRPL